jgi:hypothetical protein
MSSRRVNASSTLRNGRFNQVTRSRLSGIRDTLVIGNVPLINQRAATAGGQDTTQGNQRYCWTQSGSSPHECIEVAGRWVSQG